MLCDAAKDFYKIGVTTGSIENRIKKLQTGNGGEIHVVSWFKTAYPFKVEKLLHSKFGSKREVGEWFSLSDEDVFNFQETCGEIQATVETLMKNPYFNKSLPR